MIIVKQTFSFVWKQLDDNRISNRVQESLGHRISQPTLPAPYQRQCLPSHLFKQPLGSVWFDSTDHLIVLPLFEQFLTLIMLFFIQDPLQSALIFRFALLYDNACLRYWLDL